MINHYQHISELPHKEHGPAHQLEWLKKNHENQLKMAQEKIVAGLALIRTGHRMEHSVHCEKEALYEKLAKAALKLEQQKEKG